MVYFAETAWDRSNMISLETTRVHRRKRRTRIQVADAPYEPPGRVTSNPECKCTVASVGCRLSFSF